MENVPYNQPSAEATPKTAAAGIGGSLSIVLIFFLKQMFDIDIPAEVASAATTVIAFLSAYMTHDRKPPAAAEIIENSKG